MRVLLIEAEEALELLLRYNLEAEGHEVESVSRGGEAEVRLRQQHFDLAVLNATLPDLSGTELCRRIREAPVTEQLPVIMVSADAEETDAAMGRAAGADMYVVLPLSVPDFMSCVRAHL